MTLTFSDHRGPTSGKVFVTGGSGHLGNNLVRRLLADGEEVRALCHPEHNNQGLRDLEIELVYGDIRDYTQMRQLINGCSRVYHCAAKISTLTGEREEKLVYDTNVLGTRNVLRAALENGVGKVVVTGSFSAVGFDPNDPSQPTDEDSIPFYPFTRHMPYGHTKHLVEHYCLKEMANGLNVVVATSCAIIGPNDYIPSRLGRTLCDFANGKLRAFIPGGFEFVAARDIVSGHILAMQQGRPGHKYIFNTEFLTVDELMGLFEAVTGRPRPRLRLPAGVMKVIAHGVTAVKSMFFPNAPHRFTPMAVHVLSSRRHAVNTKAREELGYQPSNMRDAIRDAFEFFKREGRIGAN